MLERGLGTRLRPDIHIIDYVLVYVVYNIYGPEEMHPSPKFKGNNQLYPYMLTSSSFSTFYPNSMASKVVYYWKWSSLNCASVQNRVQISVHSPVHESRFYTYPVVDVSLITKFGDHNYSFVAVIF